MKIFGLLLLAVAVAADAGTYDFKGDTPGMPAKTYKAHHKEISCRPAGAGTETCWFRTTIGSLDAGQEALIVDEKIATIGIKFVPPSAQAFVDIRGGLFEKLGSPTSSSDGGTMRYAARWDTGSGAIELQYAHCSMDYVQDGAQRTLRESARILNNEPCRDGDGQFGTSYLLYADRALLLVVQDKLQGAAKAAEDRRKHDL